MRPNRITQEVSKGHRDFVDNDGDHLSPVPDRTDIGEVLNDEGDPSDDYP
jgi:hypothetical protein